jgi:hypothetical protein
MTSGNKSICSSLSRPKGIGSSVGMSAPIREVARELDELLLIIEIDFEPREKTFLPKKPEWHVVPLVGIEDLNG